MTKRDQDQRLLKLAVGVDDSPSALTAMAWARALHANTNSTILAVNAFENPYSEMPPATRERLIEERHAVLDKAVAALGPENRSCVDPVVRFGSPRDVILDVAQRSEANLILTGRGGDGRPTPGVLHLESVAEHLFRHSPVPCLAVPTGADPIPGPVTIGVDGSDSSLAAVSWLAANATAIATDITAVHVPQPPLLGALRGDDDGALSRWLEEWSEPIAQSGIPTQAILTAPNNSVAEALLAVAQASGARLLVTGARSPGEILDSRAGGVAVSTLHHAVDLPLLMVPAAGRE